MATEQWQSLEGKFWRLDIGSTKDEALASNNPTTLHVTTDGYMVMNGEVVSSAKPTLQTSAVGSNSNYIYSASGDEMHTALSGKIWMYTHTDGNLFMRIKHWGASNDTNESNYSQVMVCHHVSRNQDGLMDKYVYARILNHNLAEGQSTTDKVIVNYTNFADSGNKQLELTKATTAKAGVMTVAQVNALNKASEDIQTLNESLQGFMDTIAEQAKRIVTLEKQVAELTNKLTIT